MTGLIHHELFGQHLQGYDNVESPDRLWAILSRRAHGRQRAWQPRMKPGQLPVVDFRVSGISAGASLII